MPRCIHRQATERSGMDPRLQIRLLGWSDFSYRSLVPVLFLVPASLVPYLLSFSPFNWPRSVPRRGACWFFPNPWVSSSAPFLSFRERRWTALGRPPSSPVLRKGERAKGGEKKKRSVGGLCPHPISPGAFKTDVVTAEAAVKGAAGAAAVAASRFLPGKRLIKTKIRICARSHPNKNLTVNCTTLSTDLSLRKVLLNFSVGWGVEIFLWHGRGC